MPPQSSAPRRISLEWASVWALAVSIIIATLVVTPGAAYPLLPTKLFVLTLGALTTLAVWILARLARGNLILPPPLLMLALWLPALAYALSAVFSGGSASLAFWGSTLESDSLVFMCTTAVLGTLAALIVRREDQYRAFFKAMAVGMGLFILAAGFVLVVGQFAPSVVSPAFAIAGTSKGVAFLLGLSVIVLLLAFRFLDVAGKVRGALFAFGALALVELAILNISTAWIFVGLVALGLFVEAIMRRRSIAIDSDFEDMLAHGEPGGDGGGGEARSFAIPLIVLAVALFFLVSGTLGNALASAFHVSTLDVRPSWQSTLAVGGKVYGSSPVFGAGPGSFGAEWLKYRDQSLNSTVFWNIDFTSGIGFIPTSAIAAGIVGALSWILLLGVFLYSGFRTLIMRAPRDAYVYFVSVTSFIAALCLFALAVIDAPGPLPVALAFVFAGIFASSTRYGEGANQWGVVFARSPRLGFVVVFGCTLLLLASVWAAYALIERYIAVADLSRASVAANAGDLDTADAAVGRSLVFSRTPAAYQLQANIAGARLSSIVTSTTLSQADALKEFQATLSAGINAGLAATKLAPNDYRNWIALGNLYSAAVPLGVANAYESAKDAYQHALDLNPTNPQLYYVLGQLEIAHKDLHAAESDLKQAVALKNDYTAAILLLSQVEVSLGNVKDALAAAVAAAYFTPNDPNVLFEVGVLFAAQNDLANAVQAFSAAVAANPKFANARYLLAAVYAKQKNYQSAIEQLQAVADLSADNATAVKDYLAALEVGKDPFPQNLLTTPQAAQ